MSDNEELVVAYWGIRGLAAPLRAMLMYSETPFKSVSYCNKIVDGEWDNSSWFSVKPSLKEKNPLINLPYVKDGDLIITQSNACQSYLGRKVGLYGQNAAETVECEQLLCEVMDVRNNMVRTAYPGTDDVGAWLTKTLCGPSSSMAKLNAWLEMKADFSETNPFFVGKTACAADFHIWEMCDQARLVGKVHADGLDPLASFPSLMKFHTAFAATNGMQRYLSSKLANLPMNNVMATIGSNPDGSKFDKSKDVLTWTDTDGVY